MARRVFSILSALSLMLLVVTVGAWLGSTRYVWMASVSGMGWAFTTSCDGAVYGRLSANDDPDHPWSAGVDVICFDVRRDGGRARTREQLAVLYRPQVERTVLGFGVQPDHESGYVRRWTVRVPYAALVCSLAILPVLRAKRARDKDRSSGALCPACGYDLRATPGRCPECGHGTGEDLIMKNAQG